MKHLLLTSLLTLSFPLASSAFLGDKRLTPKEIISACSDEIESIQKMEQSYIMWTQGESQSSIYTKALSSTGVSSIAAGAVLFLASPTSIYMQGPISAVAGVTSMTTSYTYSVPLGETEELELQIIFPNKEDAQSFLTERAYRIDGLQTEKFKEQCLQQVLSAGDTEARAKFYCSKMTNAVSYQLETGQLCKVQ